MQESVQQQIMCLRVYSHEGKKFIEGYALSSMGYDFLVTGKKDELYELSETQIKDIISKYIERNPSIKLETEETLLNAEQLNLIYNEDLDRELDLQIEEQNQLNKLYSEILENAQTNEHQPLTPEDYLQIINNSNSSDNLSQLSQTTEIEEEQVTRILN